MHSVLTLIFSVYILLSVKRKSYPWNFSFSHVGKSELFTNCGEEWPSPRFFKSFSMFKFFEWTIESEILMWNMILKEDDFYERYTTETSLVAISMIFQQTSQLIQHNKAWSTAAKSLYSFFPYKFLRTSFNYECQILSSTWFSSQTFPLKTFLRRIFLSLISKFLNFFCEKFRMQFPSIKWYLIAKACN